MRSPIDRGVAVVKRQDSGAVDVMVCAGWEGSGPVDVFAVHRMAAALKADADVEWMDVSDRTVASRGMVVVWAEAKSGGTVIHVQSPRSERGLVRNGRVVGTAVAV